MDALRKMRMLRDRTECAWFSQLLRHPARKWSGSIFFSTPRSSHGARLENKKFETSEAEGGWLGSWRCGAPSPPGN